jgi:hypothetical protein
LKRKNNNNNNNNNNKVGGRERERVWGGNDMCGKNLGNFKDLAKTRIVFSRENLEIL